MRKSALLKLLAKHTKRIFLGIEDRQITLLRLFIELPEIKMLADDENVTFEQFFSFVTKNDKNDIELFSANYLHRKQLSSQLFLAFIQAEKADHSRASILADDQILYHIGNAYCDAPSIAALSQTASFFYYSAIGSTYWKEKLVAVGCPEKLLTVVRKTQTVHNYKELYCAFLKLEEQHRKNIELWELLCLSGEPVAIKHAKHNKLIPDSFTKMNPLHFSALRGSIAGMQFCLDDLMIEAKSRSKQGEIHDKNALHYAVMSGSIEAVDHALIKLNCDVASRDAAGKNAFLIATASGQLNVLIHLVACCPEDAISLPYYKTTDGESALFLAARNGHPDIIEYLHNSQKMDPSNYFTTTFMTPLMSAACGGHVAMMDILINKYNMSPYKIDTAYMGIIHHAAFHGKLDAVKYCIDVLKIPFNVIAQYNSIALFYAAARGHLDVVKYLATLPGADASFLDLFGNCALHFATQSDNAAVIDFLVTDLGIPHSVTNHAEETPLHIAVTRGNANSVTQLLALGADPRRPDSTNRTAIMLAADKPEIAKILSEHISGRLKKT